MVKALVATAQTLLFAMLSFATVKDCSLGALAGESMFWSRLGFFPDPIRLDAQGCPVVGDTLTPETAARHRMMQGICEITSCRLRGQSFYRHIPCGQARNLFICIVA